MAVAPIVFAVRGSVRDGLGHVMRCRAVAEELAQLKVDLRLLVLGDDSSRALLRHTGLTHEYCESDEMLVDRVEVSGSRCVVFDMLRFEESCFEQIQTRCATISLSPVFNCLDRVEHLFHRTIHDDPQWRKRKSFPVVHKGLEYAIISERCHRIPGHVYRSHVNRSPLSIAISMGGADAPNRTLSVLNELKKSSCSLLIWVALGEAYTHSYEDLVASVRGTKHEVILIKSNESMWRVLQGSCVLICSSGLTPYEAAFVGLPSIILPERQEGVFLVQELEEKGACRILASGATGMQDLRQLIEEWEADRNLIQGYHEAAIKLIKARGTRRVASAIKRIAKRSLQRSASS